MSIATKTTYLAKCDYPDCHMAYDLWGSSREGVIDEITDDEEWLCLFTRDNQPRFFCPLHILRHLPLLRVPAGGREASRNGRPDMVTLDPPPDLVEIAEDLDAMRTAEAVSLLFILFCRDPQFRRSLYKLDPVLFRRFTNGEVWL